ncbi:MAG TPA: addiction module protein [Gemmataceae bacterium]|nr:addiction module protein [Gemmataceae bacterium]
MKPDSSNELEPFPRDRIPPDLTDEQARELDRRLALMDADPTALRPWAEVEARVFARLPK